MKKPIECKKKKYDSRDKAKGALKAILNRSGKQPWRDEVCVYMCDQCNSYHISSKTNIEEGYVPNKIKEKSYLEIQKEKWGSWLQNYSSKGAVINQHNKKYST